MSLAGLPRSTWICWLQLKVLATDSSRLARGTPPLHPSEEYFDKEKTRMFKFMIVLFILGVIFFLIGKSNIAIPILFLFLVLYVIQILRGNSGDPTINRHHSKDD